MSDLVCPVIHKVSENGTESAEKCPVPHNQQKPQQPSTGTSSHEDINEGIVGRGIFTFLNHFVFVLFISSFVD